MVRNSNFQLDAIRKQIASRGEPSDATVDAFGRMRVSNPATIFDSKQLYDAQPLLWDDQQTSGSGTSSIHSPSRASSMMSVSDTTAGTRTRQTFQRHNYQPGKSQKVTMTFVFHTMDSGITKRVGAFDDDNGLFIECDGGTLYFVVRQSVNGIPNDQRIAQDDWNLDKMNGFGPSRITLDPTKAQIFYMDFEWLGVGGIRFGFVINNQVIYAHYQANANRINSVYMSTPNLPLRYEISNDGTGPASSLEAICTSVTSEGGQEPLGVIRSVDRGRTRFETPASGTATYPLLSIRLRSDSLGATINPITLYIQCLTADNYRWVMLWNPDIGGVDAASWTNVDESSIQFDISRTATNVLTNGYQMASGYVRETLLITQLASFTADTLIKLGAAIDGTRDEIVIGVQSVAETPAAEEYFASLVYYDIS